MKYTNEKPQTKINNGIQIRTQIQTKNTSETIIDLGQPKAVPPAHPLPPTLAKLSFRLNKK